MTKSTSSTSRVTRGTAGQGTTRGAGQVTGVLVSVQTEGASRGAVGTRHITVTVPCSTTSVGTGCSGHPDVEATGGVTTLRCVAATSVSSWYTLVTSTILTTHARGTILGCSVACTSRVTGLDIATGADLRSSVTQLTGTTSRARQVTCAGSRARTGVVGVVVTEARASGAIHTTDTTVTIASSTTSVATVGESHPAIRCRTAGGVAELCTRAATSVASRITVVTVTGLTSIRTAGVAVLVPGAGNHTDLLGVSTTGAATRRTLVAVTVVTTLRTAGVGVLVTGAGQRADSLGRTATGSTVRGTLITVSLLDTAVVVTTVGARGRAPASVHTNVHASSITQLDTVSEGAAVQATVTEVTRTTIGTGLVAAPLVAGTGRLTDLLHGARTLASTRCTRVAVSIVTAVGADTNLTRGPLVSGQGCGTAFHVGSVTAASTWCTGIAMSVVTTIAAGTNLAGAVAGAVRLTSLDISTGASFRTGCTDTTADGTARSCAHSTCRHSS